VRNVELAEELAQDDLSCDALKFRPAPQSGLERLEAFSPADIVSVPASTQWATRAMSF
jgi:hypothetical protein